MTYRDASGRHHLTHRSSARSTLAPKSKLTGQDTLGYGCSSFGVRSLGGEGEVARVAALVIAVVFLADVVVPVGVIVAVGAGDAQPQDGLGTAGAPPGSGDGHAVFDQVAAGPFDDPGRDRPPGLQRPGVVQVGLLGLQVGHDLADVALVLGPGGRARSGE